MGGCVSKKKALPGTPPPTSAVKKNRGRKKKGNVAFQLQNGVTAPGDDVSIRRVQSDLAVNASQVIPKIDETDNQSSIDAASMNGTPLGTPRSRVARMLSANEVFHDCQVAFTDSEEEYELANSETLENPYGQSPEQRRVPYSHLREHFTSRLPSIPSSMENDQGLPSTSAGRGQSPNGETHINGGVETSQQELRDREHEVRSIKRRMSDPGPGRGGKRPPSLDDNRPPPLRVADSPGTPKGGVSDEGHALHLHFPKLLRKVSKGGGRHTTPERERRTFSGGRRWSEPEPPEDDEPSTSGGIVCLPKIRIGLERPDSRGSSFRKGKNFFTFGRRSSGGGMVGDSTPDGRRRVVRFPRWGESVRECAAGQPEDGCYAKVDAASFVLRGKTYMKDKKKILATAHPIYELLGVDVYHSVKKLMHVAQLMEMPCRGEPLGRDGLPRLLVVNLQFPLYAPSIFGGAEGQDGEGFNVIMCFRLNEDFEKNPPPAAFALLKRFLADEQEKVGLMGSQVSLRDRLKLIASMRNVDEVDMSLTERKLATNYNGKPVLSRPQHVFFQEDNYLEVDIDVHRFSFLARKGLESFRQRLKQMVIDFALIIQGNRPDELPEHVLCCACVNKFDFVSSTLSILDEDQREHPDRTPRSSETPNSVKLSETPGPHTM